MRREGREASFGGRTAREEAVLGEDCDGIDEQDADCAQKNGKC